MYGRRCRDGIFGNLNIKAKEVLDEQANLNVNNATFRGDAEMKKNVTVCGDLLVQGTITQIGEEYDVIICGAGAAGCIIAKDVSDQGISVLVLEQGTNQNENPFSKYPFVDPTMGFAPSDDGTYGYAAKDGINFIQPTINPRTVDLIQGADVKGALDNRIHVIPAHSGRGYGGACNHNYLAAYHTTDQWDDHIAGNYGGAIWSSTNTRIFKNAIETYTPFDGSVGDGGRGDSGPISIIKFPEYDETTTYMGNVLDCMVDPSVNGVDTAVSAPILVDHNLPASGTKRFKIYQQTLETDTLTRAHPGRAYLGASVIDQTTGVGVGGRPLKVISNAYVNKILFDENKIAKTVVASVKGQTFYFTAKQKIVISAGALRSPGILERSGYGNATILNDIGIDVVCDNPAVGENYINHYATMAFGNIDATIADSSPDLFESDILMNYPGSKPYAHDIYNAFFWTGGPLRAFDIVWPQDGWLEKSGLDLNSKASTVLYSFNFQPTSRGSVHIVDCEPSSTPEHIRNFQTSAEDLNNSAEMIRFFKNMEVCLANVDPSLNFQLNLPPTDTDFSNANVVADWARHLGFPLNHHMGTCRMGLVASGNVVSGNLHVYNVGNLMVADTSVFPIPTNASTQLPAMVVGKIAANVIINNL